MQTQCVRCHKTIDTVQGYKFSPTEYVCMSCYDEYKAERVARAKKQHKNPLIEQFGAEPKAAVKEPPPRASAPQQAPSQSIPAPPGKPGQQQAPPAPPSRERTQAPTQPPAASSELCVVCKKPLSAFKVPLKGGKQACMDCNDLLRDVAKNLVLTIQCPHCGKEIQISQE